MTHLAHGIEVRRDAHACFLLLGLRADGDDGCIVESDHGRHRTGPLDSGRVHQLSTQAHGEYGGGEIERPPPQHERKFPQGVARRQCDFAEAALDDPVYGGGVHEHRRLGVLGKHESVLGPLPSELGDGEPQNVIRLFEHPSRLGIGGRQSSTHPDVLGALSWKEKCEGHVVRTARFYQRTAMAPQVSPAPNATSKSFIPGSSRPSSIASSIATGMVAELIFPYRSTFTNTFSIGSPA